MNQNRAFLLRISFLIGICWAGVLSADAAVLKGKIYDRFQEPLIGATIHIQQTAMYGVTGLDGSFQISNLKPGHYTILISFIGYKAKQALVSIAKEEEIVQVQLEMETDQLQLGEVVIQAGHQPGSEGQARSLERNSPNTINVISAKAIALSPDISVANVVQRVSGLSVERSTNGDPQYAIVRGMDKRYGYTLVNGVKIPSPDNKNRYVPLDIFPSSLLERLEVYKSLTADMEGDAISGGLNMVMKGAPETLEIRGDLQLGYNYINLQQGFDRFNASVVRPDSPRELYGVGYQAQPSDFTRKNLETERIQPLPDVLGTFSVGNRFLKRKLGIMVGGSFQNAYRGTESIWFDAETDRFGSNLPALSSLEERKYSTQQTRLAGHSRVDYRLNEKQEVSLYTGYYQLNTNEVREIFETKLDGRNYSSTDGNAILTYTTRTRLTKQRILSTTLQGKHQLLRPLSLNWSAVVSKATNDRPDNARFTRNGELKNFEAQPINVERRNPRQWERNADTDYSGYANLTFQPTAWANSLIKTGGMVRQRKRDNYFNRYLFDPNPGMQVQGIDWNTYGDVQWEVVNPAGSATDELNHKADERITAGYLMGKFEVFHTEVNAGIRMEYTKQGYTLKNPKDFQAPDSAQTYTDVLPSVSLKYKVTDAMNLRLTYYKAISRPGFFEIVPYVSEDDGYDEVGNPGLKRVKADNLDIRWEYFPTTTDQLLIGAFYKRIQDPIEYTIVRQGINNEAVLKPGNFGTAFNMGFELDVCKYFNKFGIKSNYTFTHSKVTTEKAIRTRTNPNDPSSDLTIATVNQTRPLQGQALHIGNISFLYKDTKQGIESQLSAVYTGERLEVISPFLDNDLYARPIVQLDFSVEKRLSSHFDVFLKATNLLNSPYEVYIKKAVLVEENNPVSYPHQAKASSRTLVRRDQYYQSCRVGLRMQF